MRIAGGWSIGLCGCLGNLRFWELGANPAWIWVEGVGDSGGVAELWVGSWHAGSRHSLFPSALFPGVLLPKEAHVRWDGLLD